jgi:hypothetical protein
LLEHFAAFAHEVVDSVGQRMAVDHDLYCIDDWSAHDSLAQLGVIYLAAAAENGFACFFVQVLGVGEYAIEIEDDGAEVGRVLS